MSVDMYKVLETAIVALPVGLIGAYVGAKANSYMQRSKPSLSLTDCRVGSEEDLIGIIVDIPDNVADKVSSSPWIPSFEKRANLGYVLRIKRNLEEKIGESRTTIRFVSDLLSRIDSYASKSTDEKRKLLGEIFKQEHMLIDSVITASLVRGELQPEIDIESVKKTEVVAPLKINDGEDESGWSANLGSKYYRIQYRDHRDQDQLEPFAIAVSHFYVPYLKSALSYAEQDLLKLVNTGPDLLSELDKIIESGHSLIVEADIVNKGMSPSIFMPHAILRLFGSDNKNIDIELTNLGELSLENDPIKAMQQKNALMRLNEFKLPEGKKYIVAPGSAIKLRYRSLMTIGNLERKHDNLLGLLNSSLFSCKLAIKRADVDKAKGGWVFSTRAKFGDNTSIFPSHEISELESELNS